MSTANDRLRERLGSIYSASLIAAAGLHLLVFQLSPTWTAGDWSAGEPSVIDIATVLEIAIPPAPEPLGRPALPVPSADVAPDATVPNVPFEDVPVLPPPPPPAADRTVAPRSFVPYQIPPRLQNADEFLRELERVYPSSLRSAGIGGVVRLVLEIDEGGRVLGSSVGTSSGYSLLDEAALSLTGVMRFSPAMNRDQPVAVRVSIPVQFEIRREDR